MGYETKMYFVQQSAHPTASRFIKKDGEWFEVWMNNPADTTSGSFYFGYDKDETRHDLTSDDIPSIVNRTYSQVIAKVAMCSIGSSPDFTDTATAYFYDTDGNTPVIEDRYDAPLKQASLSSVITWLEGKVEGSKYRRYRLALALAKSMVDDYNDIQVLFYGH